MKKKSFYTALIVYVAALNIVRWHYPDMTDMRFFIEHWYLYMPIVIVLGAILLGTAWLSIRK